MANRDEEIIQAAARVLMRAVLDEVQSDPHQWSERPCPTCRTVGAIMGRPFGCYVYAEKRQRERAPSAADEKEGASG